MEHVFISGFDIFSLDIRVKVKHRGQGRYRGQGQHLGSRSNVWHGVGDTRNSALPSTAKKTHETQV